jgi:hypothetical protein
MTGSQAHHGEVSLAPIYYSYTTATLLNSRHLGLGSVLSYLNATVKEIRSSAPQGCSHRMKSTRHRATRGVGGLSLLFITWGAELLRLLQNKYEMI